MMTRTEQLTQSWKNLKYFSDLMTELRLSDPVDYETLTVVMGRARDEMYLLELISFDDPDNRYFIGDIENIQY